MVKLYLKVHTRDQEVEIEMDAVNTVEINELFELCKSHVRAAPIFKGQKRLRK